MAIIQMYLCFVKMIGSRIFSAVGAEIFGPEARSVPEKIRKD